ncbi:hypothetical protein [Streptacidiphilus rugosus]|uniref:hypothetical protein n=1 Tax=Streptacidiphilus rugosus TaxID=405783 RepID=UPI001E4A241B|nr:hypothetical protein [Streptacidiphilus rugosus]
MEAAAERLPPVTNGPARRAISARSDEPGADGTQVPQNRKKRVRHASSVHRTDGHGEGQPGEHGQAPRRDHGGDFGSLHPEAAYFGAKDGCRTAFIVFDLKETSDIPKIVEPFFMKLGAKVEFIPVMNFEDVQAGLSKVSL